MKKFDVAVIGGGPAGLAAAISAHNEGANVCLIEREAQLGGILKQCIHDGFGLVRFKEKLSGPEYAARYIKEFEELGIGAMLSSFVTAIDKPDTDSPKATDSDAKYPDQQNNSESNGTDNFVIHLVTSEGIELIEAKALVLATGCRERTARQVGIHGTRPAGIFTAGSAQNYINLLGQQIGRKCVILGSGDIGLIMARRLTLEGSEIIGVYEVLPVPSGLARNIHQCLDDFNIPLHLSTTVTCVYGKERVEAVDIARVDENLNPIPGTEEHIECDTLIVSVGLIPENELAESLEVTIDPKTRGPFCDTHYQTDVPGVFSCGNSFHVFDLVDYVSESGDGAGKSAAIYARGELRVANKLKVDIPPKKAVEPGKLVCIGCPKGCELTVSLDGKPITNFGAVGTDEAGFDADTIAFYEDAIEDNRIKVEGNTCFKGMAFAYAELTNPTRVLTTSVRTSLPGHPVIPVRTSAEIPKPRLFEAMKIINAFTLDHEVEVGDVVLENLMGTGVDVIACTNTI